MRNKIRRAFFTAAVTAAHLAGLASASVTAADAPAKLLVAANAPTPAVVHITLEEAKQQAIAKSKLLDLAGLNAESKAFVVKTVQSDYFPKVVGTALYLHFNDELGSVISTPGRTITGPRGVPLASFGGLALNVPVINQDSAYAQIGAVQPLTDLLKVRQGVKIARADEQIALTQREKGIRELASGVEQLYWGLLAVRRIRAGAEAGVQGAEALAAATKLLDARTALVEARQGLQQATSQEADLQEQLDGLLDLPLCTTLELVEPPLPLLPFHCADEVTGLAVASSPDVHEAEQTVCKAQAALAAGKLDYIPSIGLVGGYVDQTVLPSVQQNIGYVGVAGSYTFVDWGKRRNTIRERQNLVAMATLKLSQTQDEVRQKAAKMFRELMEDQEALKTAEELAGLRKEAAEKAAAAGLKANIPELLKASKDSAIAEVDAVKADLAYRTAYVQLMSMIGK